MNRRPGREARLFLAALPFALLVLAYLAASAARLATNPDDKLLPWPSAFVEAMRTMALEPDKRSGDYLFWLDTYASLLRILCGLAIASAIGLVLGIAIGLIPYVRASLAAFVAVVCMVPPLAILPILFITLGLGEVAKITLIVLGVAPYLTRDLSFRVAELPEELLIKAQTLGASTWQMALRVVLPAAPAPPALGPAPLARPRLAVPDRRRGDRLDRGAGLPDLPGPPLPGHGRDPALRRLDHAARLRHGPAARLRQPAPVPLGRHRMSSVKVHSVWKSFGDRSVLERDHAGRDQRQLRHHGGGQRLRQDHLPAHAPGGRGSDQGQDHRRRRAAAARSPTATAGSSSSATRCSRI